MYRFYLKDKLEFTSFLIERHFVGGVYWDRKFFWPKLWNKKLWRLVRKVQFWKSFIKVEKKCNNYYILGFWHHSEQLWKKLFFPLKKSKYFTNFEVRWGEVMGGSQRRKIDMVVEAQAPAELRLVSVFVCIPPTTHVILSCCTQYQYCFIEQL